jgi:hypothetical protein
MKLADIVKVIANEFGTSDLKEINKLLKDQPAIKFRITGKSLKHLGFTGQIKSLSEEGIKAYMTNKVSLIRLPEIETFEKAKRSEWFLKPAQPKPTAGPAPVKASVKETKTPKNFTPANDDDFDENDGDSFDEEDLPPKKLKRSKAKPTGKQNSKFIPLPKKP